jgi:hypothetical protein
VIVCALSTEAGAAAIRGALTPNCTPVKCYFSQAAVSYVMTQVVHAHASHFLSAVRVCRTTQTPTPLCHRVFEFVSQWLMWMLLVGQDDLSWTPDIQDQYSEQSNPDLAFVRHAKDRLENPTASCTCTCSCRSYQHGHM